MARAEITEDNYINSIVGPGTFFRGHIELQGLLRVDGDFSGSIRTDGRVIVGKSGRADCAIEAGTVVIGGLFRGEIVAYEKVVLLASCIVLGNVAAPRLIVAEGVLLSGRCRITGSADAVEAPAAGEERKKALLLETVRRREESTAARAGEGPDHDGPRGRSGTGVGAPDHDVRTRAATTVATAGPPRSAESWNG